MNVYLMKGKKIMSIVSPSLLACDFTSLKSEIERVDSAEWLHFDVMDGHFVNNISIGVPVLQSVRKATNKLLDVHLMISEPYRYADAFLDAGADLLCFHLEADKNPSRVIKKIRDRNKRVGIAIKPSTPVEQLYEYIEQIDMALIMTVTPGFGGQAFMDDMVEKIKKLREKAKDHNPKLLIQVDGGINMETAKICVDAGADVLVAGSFIFNSQAPNEVCESLMRL